MQETVDTLGCPRPRLARRSAQAGAASDHPPVPRPGARGAAWPPLPWLSAPALALIAFAVIWPVYEMFRISLQHYSPDGFLTSAPLGWSNYTKLFQDPNFGPVMART